MIQLKGKYNKDCKIFVDEMEESCYPLVQEILDSNVSDGVKVRIMPDTHAGKGIVIGFTMPLTNMVNPEHVGVDLGCGVVTAKLKGLYNKIMGDGEDMGSVMKYLDDNIRKSVPMGTNYHTKTMTNIDFKELDMRVKDFHKKWVGRYKDYGCPTINEKYINDMLNRIDINPNTFYRSIGTLGGGELIAIRIG